MTVSTFTQPNYSSDLGTTYPTNIDGAINVLAQIGQDFAPHAAATPNLTVLIDAGKIIKADGTLVEQAQQTATFVAPTVNPRIDRIVIDMLTGAYSIIAGTEAASPTAPAITAGKLPCAHVSLTVGQTQITNANITDERTTYGPQFDGFVRPEWYGAVGNGTADDTTAIQTALNVGGVVLFTRGKTYLHTKLNLQSNTTIIGYGATLKLKNATDDTMLEAASRSNIRVYGLTFNGNKANQTVLGPLLGLYLQDCTDFIIRDCVAYDVYGIGFGHNCCQRGFFVNNYSHDNADNGVDFNGDYHTVARTNQGCKHIVVSGNISMSNAKDGIFFGHDTCEANQIVDNVCVSNTQHGLHLGESSAYAGAQVLWRNNKVDGNICANNTGAGIVAWTPKSSAFLNNHCFDNGTYGIRISRVDAAQSAAANNLISANQVGNITGTQQYGIVLEGGEDTNVINNNRLYSNVTTAISKTGASTFVEDNWFNGVFQRLSGSYTTPSIAAGNVDATAISFATVPYAAAPKLQVTVRDTTGTERFICKSSVLTSTGATLRTVNLDASITGTAVIDWAVVGGGF